MTPQTASVLEVRGLEIRYGGTPAVTDASFTVEYGEFVTLLGPSGSGKTTLLRAIAGFVTPAAGEVRLGGASMRDVPPFQRDIGMVFQNYALFPHMTVVQNLSFGPRRMGVPRAEIAGRVDESLAQVRLSEYRDRYPHQLSGGQQQRVAIARALAIRPAILLLDEPMSNLDARLRAEMRGELIALLKRLDVTAVSVTHNQEEALAMSDRIIVMAAGRICQIGTPSDVYTRPADPFTAGFVGDTNLLQGSRSAGANGLACFATDCGAAIQLPASSGLPAGDCLLLIRPESIEITSGTADGTANQVQGRLAGRAYMGAFEELRVAVGERELLVKKPVVADAAGPAVGEPVLLRWPPSAVIALPPS